ncbi:MAG: RepB family plasmid replication initiator protein, partial [Hymenobacter sp.]
KVMLMLKDPKGIEAEQYTKVSMFQKHVLDLAVAQINQHTELRIAYQLHKKGRAFEEISFTVEMQEPQQLPIPFEDTVDPDRVETARQRLLELQILDPRLTAQILGDAQLMGALFSFLHRLKTGKLKSTSNPGGLFLTMVGLRETKKRGKEKSA